MALQTARYESALSLLRISPSATARMKAGSGSEALSMSFPPALEISLIGKQPQFRSVLGLTLFPPFRDVEVLGDVEQNAVAHLCHIGSKSRHIPSFEK